MADAVPNSPASADPFAHLYKMSKTAGGGSGDYVAINGTAIAAILLGVSSAMVLFNSWLLLVIPIAGVICAVLAFIQISQSNKTQTGIPVAAVGLVLSLGFGGYYCGQSFYSWFHNRTDEEAVVSTIHRFGDLIKTKDYAGAYGTFDDHLKAKVTPAMFEVTCAQISKSPLLGNLEGADWNELLMFDTDVVTGDRLANGMVKLKYQSPEPVRVGMGFRRIDGKWLIDQIPSIFPDAPDTQHQQRKPTAAGPATFGPLGPPKP